MKLIVLIVVKVPSQYKNVVLPVLWLSYLHNVISYNGNILDIFATETRCQKLQFLMIFHGCQI